MNNDVVRTELFELPGERGKHAVPHEGERIRIGAGVGFSHDAAGLSAYARAAAEAKDDGGFMRSIGVFVVLMGVASVTVAVGLVLVFAEAPSWLVAIGSLGALVLLFWAVPMLKQLGS
ncbi:hypothetical protein [Amycolatopsis panacis]|uniref:hypothetical protein n=1 Tax=Amycolatopsis panacis TaxID=2340917 RepID=UPI0011C48CF1|nr:hypothetical protein [Amycolatopsis panacis]